MITFRRFRNPDAPALVKLWNESLPGRGAAVLAHASYLEYQVFSRIYFDPEGLIIAEKDDKTVGFGHAGFGPNREQTALDHSRGVICALVVHPEHRRQGIGKGLLERLESYLQARGASEVLAGGCPPNAPFYQLLYGGSNLPGFLESDAEIHPFLEKQGYAAVHHTLVLQRDLRLDLQLAEPRFFQLRQEYSVFAEHIGARPTWWQNCTMATTEGLEFSLRRDEEASPVARAIAVELDGYASKWRAVPVGLLDVSVDEPLRRQGLAKFLVAQIMHFLKEQSYELVEAQVAAEDAASGALFRALGFQEVDRGIVYEKKAEN